MKALTLSLFLTGSTFATKLQNRKEAVAEKKGKAKIEIDLTHTSYESESKLKPT